MAYKVFISYSTKDIPNVDALRAFLQFPDVECFVSEYAVMPGAPIAATTKNRDSDVRSVCSPLE